MRLHAAAMPMNIRLLILFIVLVVVPTSVLALLAGIAVRRWETVAAARQEREAVHLVRAARSTVDRELRSALVNVRERLAAALSSGRHGGELRAQASLVERDIPFAERVYVFMNPWGFVYPGEGAGARGAAGGPETAALEAALRREISAGGGLEWTPLQVGDQAYVFGAMGQGGGLHAGFRVSLGAVIRAARDVAPPGVEMRVAPLRPLDEAAPPAGDVLVSDPLGGAIRIAESSERDDSKGGVLAEARLAAPLNGVVVRVLASSAPEGREAASIRGQLQVLGIALLGLAIIAGVGLTLKTVWADAKRSRNQADLVLGVSHDLRTPAASIRALAESLSLGRVSDPEKQKRFIASILREAERLGHLTERTLYLLRFEQGAMSLNTGSVDVRALAAEAVNLFLQRRGLPCDDPAARRAFLRVGQVDVEVRWDITDRAAVVEGDASALLQVVSNLLDNAWQYAVGPRLAGTSVPDASAGRDKRVAEGAEAVIELSAGFASKPSLAGRRGGVRISVKDNGIGLKPFERRRVFRRFYRTPEARRLHASGVGLGLAFCRYVVVEHGGSISVESEYGKGCEFAVWLPEARGQGESLVNPGGGK